MPVTYTARSEPAGTSREVALIPAPFVDISKDYVKTANGTTIGATYSISLTGTLLPSKGSPSSDGDFYGLTASQGASDGDPGVNSKFLSESIAPEDAADYVQQSLMTKTQAIRKLFSIEGQKLSIISWSSGSIHFFPRIKSISIDENEYRQKSAYTINLECDEIFHNGTVDSKYAPLGEEDYENIEHVLGLGRTDGTNAFSTDFALEDTADNHNGEKIYISDVTENWSADDTLENPDRGDTGIQGDEFPDWNITHTISATGKRAFDAGGLIREAYENAKLWVDERVGVFPTDYPDHPDDFSTPREILSKEYVNKWTDIGGILSRQTTVTGTDGSPNIVSKDWSNYYICNYTRALQVDKFSGTYAITENYTLTTNYNLAQENIEFQHQWDPVGGNNQVTISGTINGREARGNPWNKDRALNMDVVTRTKYESARLAFNKYSGNIGKVYLLSIANEYIAEHSANPVPLNSNHVSESQNHNEKDGVISFSMAFNDRSQNVPGSYTENVSVTTTSKVQQAATIPVPGRAVGPIIQDLGTKNIGSKTIAVTVQMGRGSGKPYVGDKILLYQPTSVDGLERCSWIATDQESWEPWSGRYTRTRTYNFV